jgi:hypothetical protein
MRKIIIPILLVVALKATAEGPSTRFSVFANPCINWFNSDGKKAQSDSPVFGFDAGLTVDKYFAENYAFSTGLSIGTLGGKLKYDPENIKFSTPDGNPVVNANTPIKYSLQYITLPLGLKFKTKEIGYFTYFAHLGLTSQVNINAKATSDDDPAKLSGDNIDKDIAIFNLGYHFGLGAQYSIGGNTAIVLGATLTNGFLDITNNDKSKITTSSLAIRIGLLF